MSALLSTREAAEYLKVNRHQVETWVRAGVLTVVKLPGRTRYRFAIEDLDEFILHSKLGPEYGPDGSAQTYPTRTELALNERGQRGRNHYQKDWFKRVRRVF